jgi:hypothetical protein
MSTILDALRKVEEENRTRNADMRTRLLTTPQRFDLRPPRRQRVSWLVGMGLMVGGIAVGAGIMGWGWSARSTPDAVVNTENDILSHTPSPMPAQTPTANSSPLEHVTPAASPMVPPTPAVAKEEPKVLVVSPPASVQLQSGTQTESLQPQQLHGEIVAGGPSARGVTSPLPGVPNAVPLSPPLAAAEISGSSLTRTDGEGPVQHSPFVNTSEPERIAPSPPPPLVEHRVATKAKPAAKPTPTPRAPAKKELAARPPVESPPAPLEENDVTEVAPSDPQEEEDVAETTSPPTPASVSFLQWSPEPEKRMAFIKVGDAPTTLAHEGDTVNGVTVVKIRQGAVELQSGESRWMLKAR